MPVLHHGALLGNDRYRDIEKQLVFGAPFPNHYEVARIASCETGRIVPIGPPVPTLCRGLLDTGEGFEFSRMAHRDPAAQAVLQRIYDSAAIQAAGRARGILRTAANPTEIIHYINIPLPYQVASIARLRPVNRIEDMIATGIVPSRGADMHRWHPEIVPSGEAGRAIKYRVGGKDEL